MNKKKGSRKAVISNMQSWSNDVLSKATKNSEKIRKNGNSDYWAERKVAK